VAQADGPVLIHCAAGKDRTGVLAALTHHIAGVGRDDMMADYLATNDPARLDRRLPQVTQAILELTGRTPDPRAVRVAMGVEAAYLDTAFDAMTRRHGGINGYLQDALGLNAERRDALAARLVE
jgi:protein tyrosine/serine phosphatase